jgi:hypothetical protein
LPPLTTTATRTGDRPATLDVVVAALAGWTLAANIVVIAHGDLNWLIRMGIPATALAIVLAFFGGRRVSDHRAQAPWGIHVRGGLLARVVAAALLPCLLAWSWLAFSVLTSAFLIAMIVARDGFAAHPESVWRTNRWVILMLCVAMATLALWVNRPDQDDAFYVGVAAFASSHPLEPLLAFDPMLVERTWPLIFPSYSFASYELLAAAIAHGLSLPAAAIMHIMLPPVFAALIVLALRDLAREISPGRATLTTVLGFALILILGEMPRSPAHFSFDRIFQGKAILLSVMIPYIYATTFRYGTASGSRRDLYLLGCAYVASIGTSNFGMLIAPMAGLTAALSCAVATGHLRRAANAAAPAALALPYLLWVLWQSHAGTAVSADPIETPGNVWLSVFGISGQYVVAGLILLGPALAPDARTRRLLATPLLLLFAVLLNPAVAPWIARHVTTPPVYWRVTWQTPILIYAAAALTFALTHPAGRNVTPRTRICILGVVMACGALALPATTLTSTDGMRWSFATLKTEPRADRAADVASHAMGSAGRLLAPDAVSSIVAMRENHPTLVSARGMYLYMLRDMIPADDYARRTRLFLLVTAGQGAPVDQIRNDLRELDVRVVVTNTGTPDSQVSEGVFAEMGWLPVSRVPGYTIWSRPERP